MPLRAAAAGASPAGQGQRSPKSLLIHSVQLAPHGFAHVVGLANALLREQMMHVCFGVNDEAERLQQQRYHR